MGWQVKGYIENKVNILNFFTFFLQKSVRFKRSLNVSLKNSSEKPSTTYEENPIYVLYIRTERNNEWWSTIKLLLIQR
jgi:hypothetical protein